VTAYATALILTVAVEVPIYVVGLTRLTSLARWRAARVGLVVNAMSHPLAFVVAWPLLRAPLGRTAALALIEVAVMLGEAWGVRRLAGDTAVALIMAAVANLASLAIGLVLL